MEDKQGILKGLMLQAYIAGRRFEKGEQVSWDTYNKFTGFQKPNEVPNFEQWYNEEPAYPEGTGEPEKNCKEATCLEPHADNAQDINE